ncbi:unnamed protein product, partial [Candidula unifasciata]
EIKTAILKEIREKLSIIDVVQAIIDNVMSFTVLLVVFKGFTYRRKYLNKPGFDNVYITRHLFQIEARRQELEQETLFPLRHMEKYKYLPTFAYWMTKNEAKKLIKGIIFWVFAAFHAIYYMVCDYAVYWVLDLVRRHMDFHTSSALPPHLQFHVRGQGPMSDMFKSMVGTVQPVADENLDVDTGTCLPNPKKPNLPVYRTIAILLIITFFLTIFEAYAMRMRHAVGACYYPYRERVRAVWLYNHILTRRGSFLIFMRRQLRRRFKNEKSVQKISIISRLQAQFRICKILCRLLGRRRKHCLSCGKEGKVEDLDNFIHCDNCKSPYCNECFIALGNVCTACMNPVDYGDSEDMSVETDSSEEEEDRMTRVSSLQRRKQMVKQKQAEKKPSTVLKSFQARFSAPPEMESPYGQFSSLMNKAGSRCSTSSSSEENDNESNIVEESTSQYDTDYQYHSKRSTPTHSDDERPRRKRLRKRVHKVTLDIFHKDDNENSTFWRTLPA